MNEDDVVVFERGDEPYLVCLRQHPSWFVVNMERSRNPDSWVLHRATCTFISQLQRGISSGAFTERDYIKVCGPSRAALERYLGGPIESGGCYCLNT